MAAIKAAQLGLKVRFVPFYSIVAHLSPLDCMYRKAWNTRRDMLERRMYPLQGDA